MASSQAPVLPLSAQRSVRPGPPAQAVGVPKSMNVQRDNSGYVPDTPTQGADGAKGATNTRETPAQIDNPGANMQAAGDTEDASKQSKQKDQSKDHLNEEEQSKQSGEQSQGASLPGGTQGVPATANSVSKVIERTGTMFVSHDQGQVDVQGWMQAMSARYCVLSKGAEQNEKWWTELSAFIFDDGKTDADQKDHWRLPWPKCFLNTLGEESTQADKFDVPVWLEMTLKSLETHQAQYDRVMQPEKLKQKDESKERSNEKEQSKQSGDPATSKENQPGGCFDGCWKKCPCVGNQHDDATQVHAEATSVQEGQNPQKTKERIQVENGLDRLLSVPPQENTRDGEGRNKKRDYEYKTRLKEAVQALSASMHRNQTWLDLEDGNPTPLRLFLQMGLMSHWKAQGEWKDCPVALAIRLLDADQGKGLEVDAAPTALDMENKLKKLEEATDIKKKALEDAQTEKTNAENKLSELQPTPPAPKEAVEPSGESEPPEAPVAPSGERTGTTEASSELAEGEKEKVKKDLVQKLEVLKNDVSSKERDLEDHEKAIESAKTDVELAEAQKKLEEAKSFEQANEARQTIFKLTQKKNTQIPWYETVYFKDFDVDGSKGCTTVFGPLLPCVSHVIYVQSRQMLEMVKKNIKSSCKVINVVANGAMGEDDTWYSKILSMARFQAQFLVFDNTGGVAQEISWDVQRHQMDSIEVMCPSHQVCGRKVEGSAFPVRCFHVVDPLQSLHKTHKFYDETLQKVRDSNLEEVDDEAQEKKRLQYVWEQISIFRHNGVAFRFLGRSLQFLIVFLAFLTTSASIANTNCESQRGKYDEVPQQDWQDKPGGFLDDFCGMMSGSGNVTLESVRGTKMPQRFGEMSILFPLISSVVFAVMSKLNPTEKWAHVESAAAALEREIFLYRARVGRYGKVDAEGGPAGGPAGDSQEGKGQPNSRVTFAETVNSILEDALSSDMRNDFLSNPSLADRAVHVQLYDPEAEKSKGGCCADLCHVLWRCFCCRCCSWWAAFCQRWTAFCCLLLCCHRSQQKNADAAGELNEPLVGDNDFIYPRAGSLTLRKKSEQELGRSDEVSGLQPKENDLWKGSGADYEFSEKAMDRELRSFADDGLCELQPEQYIHARLSPMLRSYNRRARTLARLVKTSQVIMTMMTGTTTLFAAIKEVDLRPVVPIVVALSALVSQCSEYERLPTRLVNIRKSVERLTHLQVWWAGLSATEQRLAVNKAKLISSTEEQADAEISAWKKSSQTNDHGPQGGQAKQDDPKQKQPPT